ncbi:NmrA family protein [Williamsia sp. Leaf354]|uniref:NmrA/HSCARG family protein n=1 Tax=Williamsia sp. Leaf354 TaxID=1736349 RepID=UPI0007014503|nr:NmrA/HSCARG family protein [Williamsia sp. Leaf354]KQR99933.1 NmrA family protein [Williamsia sp. Leaf354]
MDKFDRRVVVLGATGQQGGAVVSALLDAGWPVRAVVRDPSAERSLSLAGAGVDIVAGDLGDPESLRAAFRDAYGVFSVQPSSGQAGSTVTDDDEVRFGISVATIAEEAGVEHLVYSSAIAAGPTDTGIAHFDTKSRIEAHIRSLDIAATIIRPASFMEILMLPGMGLAQGQFSFLMRNDQPVQFIAVRDIGRVAAEIFDAPVEFSDQTLDLAGDTLTGDQLAESFSGALRQPIAYRRISDEVLTANDLLGKLVAAADSGRLAGDADVTELRGRFPFLLEFAQWLAGPGAASLAAAVADPSVGIALR